MRVDIDTYVANCLQYAQHKEIVSRPAPILEYPPPDLPWDIASTNLLQRSHRVLSTF